MAYIKKKEVFLICQKLHWSLY